jgi:hypothetical protein
MEAIIVNIVLTGEYKMSAAHTYAIKTILRALGMNPDVLETQALELQRRFLEFDGEQLTAALQTMLDYRKNQEQNEKRMLAIMDHLGISDPIENDPPTNQRDHFNGTDHIQFDN